MAIACPSWSASPNSHFPILNNLTIKDIYSRLCSLLLHYIFPLLCFLLHAVLKIEYYEKYINENERRRSYHCYGNSLWKKWNSVHKFRNSETSIIRTSMIWTLSYIDKQPRLSERFLPGPARCSSASKLMELVLFFSSYCMPIIVTFYRPYKMHS